MKSAVLALLLLWSANAAADVPQPTQSHADSVLVGNSSGNDMGNAYHVIVRNVGHLPIPNLPVAVRFVGSVSRPVVQQEPGTTVDCTALTMTRITGPDGSVTFHARVAGFDNGYAVQVRANGVLLTSILVRSTDLDGNGATDLQDLNAFRERYLFNPSAPETDFNRDGTTNIRDFVLLRDEYVRNVKGTVCP